MKKKKFMIKNTRKTDLNMFASMANMGDFESSIDVPFYIVLPAYMTSELKTEKQFFWNEKWDIYFAFVGYI